MNSISTLSDIQHCKNLQELYIRKNQIPDISDVCWLRDLPRLKNLWLEENPCAVGDPDLYRLTVIRALPQLSKLDNVAVTPEEMADAMRRGLELDHPLDGGSDRQSLRLQQAAGGRQQQVEQVEPEQPGRRESVQSPSRRVSNAVWSEERPASHSYAAQYSEPPGPPRHSASMDSMYRRESTPEEMGGTVRRVESRERYQESPHQRPQRSSYSGPPSQEFGHGGQSYRGQEWQHPSQVTFAPVTIASSNSNTNYDMTTTDQLICFSPACLLTRITNSPGPEPPRPGRRRPGRGWGPGEGSAAGPTSLRCGSSAGDRTAAAPARSCRCRRRPGPVCSLARTRR